ncbi:MAG: hypothetical protein ACM3SW_07650 [Actinomycetota bacterium]
MSVIDLQTTILWVRSLAGISLFIGCLEELAGLRNYSAAGVFSWNVFQTQFPEAALPPLRHGLGRLFSYNGVRALLCCQMAAILLLLVPSQSSWFYIGPVATILAIKLLLAYRSGYGSDGSDQMETMVLSGLLVALCFAHSKAANLGVWFIAMQAALAYAVSGLSKLVAPAWTHGEAMFKIFNTYTYGNRWVAGLLRNAPTLNLLLCWSVIVYESLFPLALVGSTGVMWLILGLGALFHLLNAFIMGLNKFFWAFVSTYPALIYCHSLAIRYMGHK